MEGWDESTSPIVLRAVEEAESIGTLFRSVYNLPITDPRYLDATDDEILLDVLIQHVAAERLHRETNPGAAQAEALAADPEALAGMLARGRDFVADPDNLERMRRALGVKDDKPMIIRLGQGKVQ